MVVEQVDIHEVLEAVNKIRNKLVNIIMITRGYGESMHEFNSRYQTQSRIYITTISCISMVMEQIGL